MTKNEFEKSARWAIVENRKTGKRYEVKGKQESQFVFSDDTKGNYKDYKWYNLWNHEYVRDVTEHEREKMDFLNIQVRK